MNQQEKKILASIPGMPIDPVSLDIADDLYYVEDAQGNGEFRDLAGIDGFRRITYNNQPIVKSMKIDAEIFFREALDRKRRGEKILIKRRGPILSIESSLSEEVGALQHRRWQLETRQTQLHKLQAQLYQKMRRLSQQRIINQDQKRINQQQLRGLSQMQNDFKKQRAQLEQEYQWLQTQFPGLQGRLQAEQLQDQQALIDFQQQADLAEIKDDMRYTHQKMLAQERFLEQMQAQMQNDDVQAFLRKMGHGYDQQEIAMAARDFMRPWWYPS